MVYARSARYSIGVSILTEDQGLEGSTWLSTGLCFGRFCPFTSGETAVNSNALNMCTSSRISAMDWGSPLMLPSREQLQTIYHPEGLIDYLNKRSDTGAEGEASFWKATTRRRKCSSKSTRRKGFFPSCKMQTKGTLSALPANKSFGIKS